MIIAENTKFALTNENGTYVIRFKNHTAEYRFDNLNDAMETYNQYHELWFV